MIRLRYIFLNKITTFLKHFFFLSISFFGLFIWVINVVKYVFLWCEINWLTWNTWKVYIYSMCMWICVRRLGLTARGMKFKLVRFLHILVKYKISHFFLDCITNVGLLYFTITIFSVCILCETWREYVAARAAFATPFM